MKRKYSVTKHWDGFLSLEIWRVSGKLPWKGRMIGLTVLKVRILPIVEDRIGFELLLSWNEISFHIKKETVEKKVLIAIIVYCLLTWKPSFIFDHNTMFISNSDIGSVVNVQSKFVERVDIYYSYAMNI